MGPAQKSQETDSFNTLMTYTIKVFDMVGYGPVAQVGDLVNRYGQVKLV